MVRLFTITLLVSSSLLFLVQPMFARMALPLLGGTPAVWNTCMVFFQASLLAGYLYAHLSTRWLGVRRQAMLHAALLLLPLLVLPIAISDAWSPPGDSNPVGWLLVLLAATLGLPFFVVASSAPLMQKWFSNLGHRSSDDPYFLYAASNAGSMTALLAYPVVIEPLMTLSQQSALWTGGYMLLGLLTIACAVAVLRHARTHTGHVHEKQPTINDVTSDLTLGRQLRWVALTAVPSSLLLGVTQYITTDLVVIPALWVIPLALYLLTFIVVFARRRVVSQRVARLLLAPAAMVLLIMLLIEATQPLSLVVFGHLAAFFVLALACHGELAADRPATRHLTSFYLMMGIGGMLGGVFNALIAPMLFTTVAEYPIAIVAAALLMMPRVAASAKGSRGYIKPIDVVLPAVLGAVTFGLIAVADSNMLSMGPLRLLLTAGIPAIGCYLLSKRPLQFGLALGVVFLAASFDTINRGNVLETQRGFFGVHRVTRVNDFHRLFHGTTLHGAQRVDHDSGEPIHPDEPLAYYYRSGPIGDVFRRWQHAERLEHVGLVGLGVGALAAYGEADQRFTFFEIDPLVQRLAEDERYFTYLAAARDRGVDVRIELGDARLTLAKVEPESFDLLVIDAFSSDSIPVHLLTREAMELYWSALNERGVIAMHISNRYLNLVPVVSDLAASMNMICLLRDDSFIAADDSLRTGREASVWVVLSRSLEDAAPIALTPTGANWSTLENEVQGAVWTDDYAHVLGALQW